MLTDKQSITGGVLDNREGSFSLFRVPHRCLPQRSVRVEEIQRSPLCAINALFAQSIPPTYLLPLTQSYSPLYRVNQSNGEGRRNEGWLKQERRRAQEGEILCIYMYVYNICICSTDQPVSHPANRATIIDWTLSSYRSALICVHRFVDKRSRRVWSARKKNQGGKMKLCTWYILFEILEEFLRF